ncbi:MAG: response regulator, partial [Phycisphaerae bacterium]
MSRDGKSNQPSNLDFHFGGFHELMPHRVDHVLLVCSLYESFILEEDGLVAELITTEFLDLRLSHAPRVARVSSGDEALAFIRSHSVDLVITMTRLGRLKIMDFARHIKEIRPTLPVIALVDDPREIVREPGLRDRALVDRIFVWNGDAGILLAIVKLIEDEHNVEHDARIGDVRVIILIENSIRFYSTYLP